MPRPVIETIEEASTRMSQEGYIDGANRSLSRLCDAEDNFDQNPSAWSFEIEVKDAVKAERALTEKDINDSSGCFWPGAFMAFPSGNPQAGRRPQCDTERLLNAYLTAWERGFREALILARKNFGLKNDCF